MQVFVWVLFAIVVLLQMADATTTIAILSKPGGREQNPVLNWLMRKIGEIPALVLAKCLVVAVSLAATGWLLDEGTRVTLIAACVFDSVVVVIFGFALYHNAKSL